MTLVHEGIPHTIVPLDWHRDSLELISAQLAGIDRFHALRQSRALAGETATRSRESQLDARRRHEVVRRQQEALIARTTEQLRRSQELDRIRPQTLVAHRNAWFVDRVCQRLGLRGSDVVTLETGADLVGAAAAEQPDLVLLEERLPMMQGVEVLSMLREVAPHARIGVQVFDETALASVLDAGAAAAFTRRVSPQEVADSMLALLRQDS